jgi:hypothetical protein
VGCLEGINPFELEPVPLNDGVNHPADRRSELWLNFPRSTPPTI